MKCLLDVFKILPERFPTIRQRDGVENRMNSDENASEIQVFDPVIQQIGRRQVGSVGAQSVDSEPLYPVHKRSHVQRYIEQKSTETNNIDASPARFR